MWIAAREGAKKQEKTNRKFLDYGKTKAHSRKLNREKGGRQEKTHTLTNKNFEIE